MEEENELMFMRMRYYEPGVGRFTKPDPFKNLTGYVYVANNPVIFIDPLGLWELSIKGALFYGVGGGLEIGISSEGLFDRVKTGFGFGLGIPFLYYSSGRPESGLMTEVKPSLIISTPYTTVKYKEGEVYRGSWEIGPEAGVFGGWTFTKVYKWPWEKDKKAKLDQ